MPAYADVMSRAAKLFRARTLERLLFAILMAAFVLRGVTPAGYMFDRAEDGGFVVRICGGSGSDSVGFNLLTGETLPADAGDHGGGEAPAREDMDCPYALTAALLAPAPVAALPPQPGRRPARFALPQTSTFRPAGVAAPLPARGPPQAA